MFKWECNVKVFAGGRRFGCLCYTTMVRSTTLAFVCGAKGKITGLKVMDEGEGQSCVVEGGEEIEFEVAKRG